MQADPLFVRDGPVVTSAGVTAGIDLAPSLAEEDHGPDTAREVARQLVVFMARPGGQSRFSARFAAKRADDSAVRRVMDAEEVAQLAGFGSSETRRRVFQHRLGIARTTYRACFRSTATAPSPS
ncbi:hypothetical protein [Streptomyces sp. IMTB 2501]|uniref:hypothetical protein n=1 Tax=Streptomyces sp. IMTB 2501 TaxID=1776340 RepID=UPI00268183CF|nr:hypothetical protein [Streptomyces sp. IMTB 2501]